MAFNTVVEKNGLATVQVFRIAWLCGVITCLSVKVHL